MGGVGCEIESYSKGILAFYGKKHCGVVDMRLCRVVASRIELHMEFVYTLKHWMGGSDEV